MTFDETLEQALELLRRRGRVSYRALKVQFHLDDDLLAILTEEIVAVHQLGRDQEGTMLVWTGDTAPAAVPVSPPMPDPVRAPLTYTPPYLAEKILTARAALEGERKQVTVLFADLKGSTELIAGLDPEEARRLLDPALHVMMDAVHRFEGTVNQVLGDGIMALCGAPVAHEDHAVRACYAALAMQAAMRRYAEEVRRTHGLEMQALLNHLVESLPTARLLLLVNYRPEYQHGWGSKTYYTQLRLDPLPPVSADEFLHALLGNAPSLEPLTQLLITRTEGNPFFLEESVRTLVETEVLVGAPGAYRLTKPLEGLQMPATVQAVLAARIDRLPPEAKRLLQTAAVIGSEMSSPLLQAIAKLPEAALHGELADRLEEAESLAEQALTLARAHQERGHQAYALRLLGDIAARRDPSQGECAVAHYHQALTLAEALGMRPLVAHCHLSLGTLYRQMGRSEEARAALATAIALYRPMGMTFWLPQAEATLAQMR